MKRMDEPDRITREDHKLANIIIESLKPIMEENYEEYVNKINCKTQEEMEILKFNYHKACLLAMNFFLSSFIFNSSKYEETIDSAIVLMKNYIKIKRHLKLMDGK